MTSDAVHPWTDDDDVDRLFDTRPRPSIGESAEEVRASLGIGARRERPGDAPDVSGLASELGLGR